MAFEPDIQPIVEDDEALAAILADPEADLPPLLPTLAYLTGDLSLLEPGLRPDPELTLEEQAGWTPDQLQRCRDIALPVLARFRDEGLPSHDPTTEQLQAIMCWITGVDLDGSYVPMLTEELAANGTDPRAPDWHKDALAPDAQMTVVIVGAGMSGILAAHRLQQAGVDYVVFEKNGALGGTWLENTYPGCRVDVSNHTYAYSFMQKHDWPQFHSSQEVLLDYFNACADDFGIRDNIRFGVEVSSMVFDEESATWSLELQGPEGESTFDCQAVISAVGQLNRPQLPNIDGLNSFAGDAWHSARWNHDVDLTGKKVGVIGTGCSAMQFIPHVAREAGELTVFQRTPNWMVPRPQYQQELPDNLMWLFTRLPNYNNWFRLRAFWRGHEGLLPRLEVDPDWESDTEISVSASNEELRVLFTMYLEMEFGDRPDLFDKVTPRYPMGAKRFVVDDGSWATTLKRDDVTLETTAIERITPAGVVTNDGVEHEFDVLLFGTGFKASEFLVPMKVVGRGGIELHDHWNGDARAYLGVVSPGFPNFFYLYGPNTNIVINGSIIYFSECEVHYVTQFLRHLLENNVRALDVKADVHDRYNEWIDEGNAKMAWGVSNVSSWYKSASGRVAQNWPYSMLEFWDQTREIDLADYEAL